MINNKLQLTLNHTGKMQGMQSLSTSVLKNPICMERAKDPASICSHCYSIRMNKAYKNLEAKLAVNTGLLTSSIIPIDELPEIYIPIFRFEAFGDLSNSTQVINYFNICRKNPRTTFALWTKNPAFIDMAIKAGHAKPKNIIIILSSPCIDKQIKKSEIRKKFPFIDKVFTVFSRDNGKINCGFRKCFKCRRCYSKKTGFYVNELLK